MSPDFEKRFSNLEKQMQEIHVAVHKILELCSTAFQDREIDPVLSAKEVADLLNVDVNVIYAKCVEGKIPFVRLGKKYKFRKSEVVTWWNSQPKDAEFSVDTYVENYLQKNMLRG